MRPLPARPLLRSDRQAPAWHWGGLGDAASHVPTPSRRRPALTLLTAAFFLSACGPAPAATDPAARAPEYLIAHVPGEAGPGAGPHLPDPALRFPRGSRVCRTSAAGPEVVLSQGMDAAGAPSLRHDAEAVLFIGRERPGDVLAVWECEPDGSGRREVLKDMTDCLGAAYLPDGRIVYSTLIAGSSPVPGVRQGAALFVAKTDGSPGARITYTEGLDSDPCVLSDGRILFSSWRDRGAGGRLGLYTVFPDGTGFAPFHLPDGDAVMPRQRGDLDVEYVLLRDGKAQARRVSWDAPMSAPTTDAESLPALACAKPDDGFLFGAPFVARPRPQGQLSVVRDDRAFATAYCTDARRNAPGAVKVRVRTWVRNGEAPRVIGDVPLADDGSFHLRLPPDTPIAFEMLDAAGKVIAGEHGPMWFRRNEVRGCVGCHDDVETGPPNVRPAAVRAAPVDLSGVDGGGR